MTAWALVAGLLAAPGVLLYGLAVATVRPPRTPAERHPDEVQAPRTDVAFTVDGLTLRGWHFTPPRGAERPLLVLVHGWSAASDRLFGLAAVLVDAGHPVLAFDLRDHGRSDPYPRATLRHWRDDVRGALAFGATLTSGPIGLVGHSMGAAACTVAVADGAPVAGLVLLAPPADVLEVTAAYLRERRLPGALLTVLLRPFWRWWAGVPYARLRPIDRIRDVQVPVLILQGDADLRVPPDHLDRFRESSAADTERVPGAGHMDLLERRETHAAIGAFLATLPGETASAADS